MEYLAFLQICMLHTRRVRWRLVRSHLRMGGRSVLSSNGQRTLLAFTNTDYRAEICSDDLEERALVSATINEMAYVFQAWLPILVWAQVDAPRYHKGFITATCFSVVLIIATMVTRHLHEREKALYVADSELSKSIYADKVRRKQLAGEVFERTDTNSSEEAQIEVNVPKKD